MAVAPRVVSEPTETAPAPGSVARTGTIARFLLGAFLPAWALAATFFVLSRATGKTPPMIAMAVMFMVFPAASAIGVQKLALREKVWEPLAIALRPSRWMLLAWLVPLGIACAALALGWLVPGQSPSLDMSAFWERVAASTTPAKLAELKRNAAALPVHPALLSLGQGMLTGLTVNAVIALGGEIGWRGLLHKELAPSRGLRRTALVTGLVWGVWQAPLVLQGFNYPEHPLAGALMQVLFCVLAAPVCTWLRARSGSVVPAAIFLGTLNATAFLPAMLTRGGSDLTLGILGLPGLVTLLALDAALLASKRV